MQAVNAGAIVKIGVKKIGEQISVEKAVKTGMNQVADSVVGAAFGFVGGGATVAVKSQHAKHKSRRDAIDHARQLGGSYSLNVLIGSKRHHVVWLSDNTPHRVIPDLPDPSMSLSEVPDLRLFNGKRTSPKPH